MKQRDNPSMQFVMDEVVHLHSISVMIGNCSVRWSMEGKLAIVEMESRCQP